MATLVHPAQKLINERGQILVIPPNCMDADKIALSPPDIYAQSSVQLYPLGTKLETADGRVFRYGLAGATSTSAPIARLVGNANLCPGATGDPDVDGYEGDPYTACSVGDTTVDLEIATTYAANFFEDGMLAVFPSGHYCCYRIAGNDVGNGTYCRVYLEDQNGLQTALTATTGITAYKSRFSQLKTIGAEGTSYMSVVGLCLADGFTSAYYMWVQTKGPCIVTPTAYFGDSANERACFYNPSDGTIGTAASYDPSSGHQCIGYLLSRTESGYGDLFMQLMLE